MPIEYNKIYNIDCLKGLKMLDDNDIDLIVADPPYFKVVNQKWDYQWRTEEEYILWSIEWLKEAYRALRKGGSIYIFGYFRMLALLLPYLEDIGFELRQQIIINKGIKAVSGRATKNYKMFPNVTESILFLVKDSKPFVKDFLKNRQKELKLKSKEINEALGVKANGGGMWSIYTGNNICKQLPTEDIWNKLKVILQFDIPYKEIQMVYNTELGITDVWSDIDFYKEKRIHPTQKPLELINRLIKCSSNENDKVLDPFMGSGSTAVSCIINNRQYIGFETDLEYIDKANERINGYIRS